MRHGHPLLVPAPEGRPGKGLSTAQVYLFLPPLIDHKVFNHDLFRRSGGVSLHKGDLFTSRDEVPGQLLVTLTDTAYCHSHGSYSSWLILAKKRDLALSSCFS